MTSFTWSEALTWDSHWAYLAPSDESTVDNLVGKRQWRDRSTVIRIVRGKRCATRASTLQEWAAALQFPWYFGQNWDAFDECITDLEWLPGTGYVFFITHADQVLSEEPEHFQIMMRALASAAQEWKIPDRYNVPQPALVFRVVFHVEPDRLDALLPRIEEAGFELEVRSIDSD